MSDEVADREIRQRVETALKQLSVLDSVLLHSDVNERTITHRLAVHLERHFDGWDVDCEYNRTGGDPERLAKLERRLEEVGCEEPLTRDTMGRTVYPDIIVHRRKTDEKLLLIEVRKGTIGVSDEFDRMKLEGHQNDPELRYRYACLIQVLVEDSHRDRFKVEFL